MTPEEIRNIDKSVEFEFLDKELEKDWQHQIESNNSAGEMSEYVNGIFRYAMLWGKVMQKYISEGKKIEDIADKSSHECDLEGITGYMYGCAVNLLSQYWNYGEELRIWHNKKYHYTGSGVVNPAVMTIG